MIKPHSLVQKLTILTTATAISSVVVATTSYAQAQSSSNPTSPASCDTQSVCAAPTATSSSAPPSVVSDTESSSAASALTTSSNDDSASTSESDMQSDIDTMPEITVEKLEGGESQISVSRKSSDGSQREYIVIVDRQGNTERKINNTTADGEQTSRVVGKDELVEVASMQQAVRISDDGILVDIDETTDPAVAQPANDQAD